MPPRFRIARGSCPGLPAGLGLIVLAGCSILSGPETDSGRSQAEAHTESGNAGVSSPGPLVGVPPKAFFVLQHPDVWADDWPAGFEGIRLFVCNPSFGEAELARIRQQLPGAICLAYTNAQGVPLGWYEGPYWDALATAFDSSFCIRNLETGEVLSIFKVGRDPSSVPTAFVMREESAEILAAFHRDVTLATSWDGIYVDQANRSFPAWKKSRLPEITSSFDIDADWVPDDIASIDALYETWKPHFLKRLRQMLGRDRIVLGNAAGPLSDPSLNGITLEGVGDRFPVDDARTWMLDQRAVSIEPFLGVAWVRRNAHADPANQLASEIEGIHFGLRRGNELHGDGWGGLR